MQLAVLACSLDHGHLLGSRSLFILKSTLVCKIDKGGRAVYWETVAYCHHDGKRLRELLKYKQVE